MLWYSGVLLCALVFFSVEIYSRLQMELLKDVDQRLAAEARGVKAVFEIEGVTEATLAEEMGEFVKEVPQGELLQLATDSGMLLWPQATPPVFPATLMSTNGERTVDSGRFRIYVTTFEWKSRTYEVLAGESLDDIRRLMARLQVIMLATAAPVFLAAGLGGYWLSRRALAPVDAMTQAARSISLESLSKRLPEPRTGDEIERLAKAWNELLGRLEASVKRIQQFTADASHELRTPLALIRSTAELALRRERDSQEYRKALSEIEQEADRMTELAESLLALARADANVASMPLAPVDVNALVTEVAEQSGRLAEAKGIRLETGADAAPAIAEANPAGLRRLLLILVDNALEHTPAGGRVLVSVSRNNGRVTLSVRDSGEGIPPAALPHIFERFYRAKEARGGKGVGLGLSIAQAIAQAHGSEIEVESRPGEGACFGVALRAAEADRLSQRRQERKDEWR
jgi:two-component system, OmpR family, heavy metal sensor histidine kinase CusS